MNTPNLPLLDRRGNPIIWDPDLGVGVTYWSPRYRVPKEVLGQPAGPSTLIESRDKTFIITDYPKTLHGPARVIEQTTRNLWTIIFHAHERISRMSFDQDRATVTITYLCGCIRTTHIPTEKATDFQPCDRHLRSDAEMPHVEPVAPNLN